MKARILMFFTALLSLNLVSAQLNNYKYVIVPTRFEIFKNENQYQTSTLVKYLFQQKGFQAVYTNNLPNDLQLDPCLGLTAEIIENSALLVTRGAIALTDCNGAEIFRTPEGSSKIKEYKGAYAEVLQEAMSVFDDLQYNYQPKAEKKAVEQPKQPLPPKAPKVEEKTLEEPASPESVPIPEEIKAVPAKEENKTPVESDSWFAQPLDNGYQLVDRTPAIRMYLMKTSLPGVFLAKDENNERGVVFEKAGIWYFEYYVGENRQQRVLNISF